MTALAAHALLTVLWVVLSGSITPPNWIAGFLLGLGVLWLTRGVTGWHHYPSWPWRLVRFGVFYLYELWLAGLRIGHDVLTPTLHNKPAIVAMPLDARTALEITVVANLISLTPGSLSLDVSPDGKTLFLHVMGVNPENLAVFVTELKSSVEAPALELLRGGRSR
jgi:multicomponent Na+:H+ antiporter subunit E